MLFKKKTELDSRCLALISEARRLYGPITPCGSAADFKECFIKVNGSLIFWFNSLDGSTHIVKSAATRSTTQRMPAIVPRKAPMSVYMN